MNEPDDRKILPLNVEPLSNDLTTNPKSGLTEAVTLPLFISVETNASSVNAALGMLNNCSPLPDINEPEAK